MNLLFEFFCRFFTLKLPVYESMDEGLDDILPHIINYGEDFQEVEYYTQKKWFELKESGYENEILHIFNPQPLPEQSSISRSTGSDYVKIVNGSVSTGAWAYLPGNKFALVSPNYELHDMGFMNANFFIITKHGDQVRRGNKKYKVLIQKSKVTEYIRLITNTEELSWEGMLAVLYYYQIYQTRFVPTLIFAIPLTIFITYLIALELR